jgi:hypothetical protein
VVHSGRSHMQAGAVREDTSIDLPALPELAEPLPSFAARPEAKHADGSVPFSIAGRRGYAAGTLDGAATEVWLHPQCVMAALHADAAFREAVVTPAGVERWLDAGGRAFVEKLFIPLDLPAVVLEWSAPDGAELRLEWTTDPRPAPPDPADTPGTLRWRRHGRALLVRADSPRAAALFAFSREPDALEVHDDAEAASAAIRVRLTLRLAPGESVRLAMVSTTERDDDLAAALAALRSVPALVRARAGALARLSASTIAVWATDPLVAEALEWAKARLDAYRAETPGVGRSLVAGYWTSHAGSAAGRADHVRFSSRDGVWTALASLAAGQFDAAAEVLRFLGQHQAPSGEIPDECTTRGTARYGGTDSTPLYLLLAARYAAWTGDLGLLREEWTRILAAYRFWLGADSAGDGLIESPRGGRDRSEGGGRGGRGATFDVAGIWAAALAELVAVAEALGEPAFAAELGERAARARRAIEQRFHDAARGVYARELGDGPDAAPDWTQAPTHAVPLLLGAVPPERMAAWLDLAAGDGFTGARDARMIAAGEPARRGEGDDGGAVWPLRAGWTSWAEYAAGCSGAAFRHWWLAVEQTGGRGAGAREAKPHGAEHRGVGARPDHASAAAMVVAPLVYGLLGAEPDATRHRLRLRPQLPDAWDRLDVERLRVGDAEVALRYRRDGARHTFIAEQTSGPVPLRLVLEPALPARRIAATRVDGRDAQLDARPFGERLLVPVQIVLDHERSLEIDVEDATTDDAA